MKNFQILDQNHGLITLKKKKFCDFFESVFSLLGKASFLYRKTPNSVYKPNLLKEKEYTNLKFLTKTMD